MPRRRFFVPPENIRLGTARLEPDQVHHLRDVLRLRQGTAVEVFDGLGNEYSGIVKVRGSEVFVDSLEKLVSAGESPLELVLGLALTKAERFEWVVEKATELGACKIIPILTRFSSVRIPEGRLRARMERWLKIAREAARQSGRSCVPEIKIPIRFEDLLQAPAFRDATRLFFYEKSSNLWELGSLPSPRVLVCIGPEGGWEEKEMNAAADAGYRIFSLGPRVLRAETAAVAALTILQHRFGDLG